MWSYGGRSRNSAPEDLTLHNELNTLHLLKGQFYYCIQREIEIETLNNFVKKPIGI